MNLKLVLILSCIIFVLGTSVGILGAGVLLDPMPLLMGVGMGIMMLPYYLWLLCSNFVSHKAKPSKTTFALNVMIGFGAAMMTAVVFLLFGFIITADSESSIASYFELAVTAFPMSMVLLAILCVSVSFKVVRAENRSPANRLPDMLILALFHLYAPIGMFFIYRRLKNLAVTDAPNSNYQKSYHSSYR